MDNNIEHEICNNCKKEIPQPNYVMHTMHCARNITLCKTCKEPIPKSQFSSHEKSCRPVEPKPLPPPLTTFEKSSYYQTRKTIEDKKVDARKERYLQRMEKLVDTGYTLKNNSSSYNSREVPSYSRDSKYSTRMNNTNESRENGLTSKSKTEVKKKEKVEENATAQPPVPSLVKRSEPSKSSGMLACKYCDLDLPKLELEEHENYCGSRTDKCLECGELVMFKDKQAHMDSNHGHLKKKGKRNVGWDSSTQRDEASSDTRSRRNGNVRTFGEFDYDPMPYLPAAYQSPGSGARKKEGDSYKEISRRLDCKTEYIRNILHDSAAITVPLRRSGTAPRNYFYHDLKGPIGPPTPPPVYRRRNPPTELVIPCEFCNVPIPHEDLIQHETGCRPDLARLNTRRRRSSEDDYYVEPRQNSVDDEELPCEFCGDMIPASRLYSHQIQCN
ncbi:TRAF-type zinc finger domain-containing protein 1-like isoform X1 [Diorhabda sublineata]|uniref:TRAF-type zinc finger domain-containing protein 1-like isoform X1 n=1 Tax=Diorhabda sublineata TaxID=1163346 RepID=UPI0024E16E92|nr:TRAF-type zinc finger domain-containing protein 1-like isoform X1 [Diorhabda sublineata]